MHKRPKHPKTGPVRHPNGRFRPGHNLNPGGQTIDPNGVKRREYRPVLHEAMTVAASLCGDRSAQAAMEKEGFAYTGGKGLVGFLYEIGCRDPNMLLKGMIAICPKEVGIKADGSIQVNVVTGIDPAVGEPGEDPVDISEFLIRRGPKTQLANGSPNGNGHSNGSNGHSNGNGHLKAPDMDPELPGGGAVP